MREKIRALLFDYTEGNLDAHEACKVNMTSGRDVLKDIIQFENGEFSYSPFVQLIEIECEFASDNYVKDERMSNTLGIDKNNLSMYQFYTNSFKRKISITRRHLKPREFIILANEEMFNSTGPIFEIRFKNGEKWSSWQAIAGKFIVAQEYRFGPGGIAEVYHSITEKEIEDFKQNFQIRYSGSTASEIGIANSLPRIINDPFNSDIRKIIDPNTFHILFDSQIIQEVSNEKSCEVWREFLERYS